MTPIHLLEAPGVPVFSLVPRPPPFSFFGLRSASVYYTERKLKNENGGGLGTRLDTRMYSARTRNPRSYLAAKNSLFQMCHKLYSYAQTDTVGIRSCRLLFMQTFHLSFVQPYAVAPFFCDMRMLSCSMIMKF